MASQKIQSLSTGSGFHPRLGIFSLFIHFRRERGSIRARGTPFFPAWFSSRPFSTVSLVGRTQSYLQRTMYVLGLDLSPVDPVASIGVRWGISICCDHSLTCPALSLRLLVKTIPKSTGFDGLFGPTQIHSHSSGRASSGLIEIRILRFGGLYLCRQRHF
jgi:hypothetical protein